MKLLFVYGTLKKGFRNQSYLQDAVFMGKFTTDGRYTMYDFDGYPAVTEQGIDAICGEVYRINSDHLAAIDTLECYPDFYQRTIISTPFGDAWMYSVEESLCQSKPRLAGDWLSINGDG